MILATVLTLSGRTAAGGPFTRARSASAESTTTISDRLPPASTPAKYSAMRRTILLVAEKRRYPSRRDRQRGSHRDIPRKCQVAEWSRFLQDYYDHDGGGNRDRRDGIAP